MLALPLLEGMCWGKGAAASGVPPKRFVGTFFPFGPHQPFDHMKGFKEDEYWFPANATGKVTEYKTLASAPFQPLHEDITWLKGLDHVACRRLGGHGLGEVFLTGADMTIHKRNGVSLDQVIAEKYASETRFRSLTLGSEGGTGVYNRMCTLSHMGPGRAIAAMHKPREIFEMLFVDESDKDAARMRLNKEGSLLDAMLGDAKSLKNRLGAADKEKLEEYLESVRGVERRIANNNKWLDVPKPKVDPGSVNLEAFYQNPKEYFRTMYDLIFLAFQTDSTRAASYMLASEANVGNAVGQLAKTALGVEIPHTLAHGRCRDTCRWDQFQSEQYAYFLKRLKNAKEGEGTMLDNTISLYGSCHGWDSHGNTDYALQLAGGKAMGLKHGRVLAYDDKDITLSNVFLTIQHCMGVEGDSFAESTGDFPDLLNAV